jgi:glycine cleavage system H protein
MLRAAGPQSEVLTRAVQINGVTIMDATRNLKTNPIHLFHRRCRFSAQLPQDLLYTNDHYWMREEAPGMWRVGLTPWEAHMLGELVRVRFDVAPGAAVRLNQSLGTLVGLQSETKIRAAAAGTFVQANPVLAAQLEAISLDSFAAGWLYQIQGTPDPETRDAQGYRILLDESVDAVYGTGPQMQ